MGFLIGELSEDLKSDLKGSTYNKTRGPPLQAAYTENLAKLTNVAN